MLDKFGGNRNGNRSSYGLGSDSVIYFENIRGKVIIAPDRDHPTPTGYEKKEARTLAEVDKLTRRMNTQDQAMFDDLNAKDRAIMADKRERVRSKLRARKLAVDCSPFERRFIDGALAYLQKKEDEMYKMQVRGYFQQREYDHNQVQLQEVKSLVPKMSDRLASLLTR